MEGGTDEGGSTEEGGDTDERSGTDQAGGMNEGLVNEGWCQDTDFSEKYELGLEEKL